MFIMAILKVKLSLKTSSPCKLIWDYSFNLDTKFINEFNWKEMI